MIKLMKFIDNQYTILLFGYIEIVEHVVLKT